MTVHFIYRSPNAGPTSLYKRRFDDDTILAFFRRYWANFPDPEHAQDRADQIFAGLFYDLPLNKPPPQFIDGLREVLARVVRRGLSCEEHCVQVLQPLHFDSALYLFDDVFVEQHPELTSYLLHDWRLPDGAGEPGWTPAQKAIDTLTPMLRNLGEGRLYFSTQMPWDTGWLTQLSVSDVYRFDGIRLPGLARLLMAAPVKAVKEWAYPFPDLRRALFTRDLVEDTQERAFLRALQADPKDDLTWGVYSDFLIDQGKSSPSAGLLERALSRLPAEENADPTRNLVQVGEHIAQAYIHAGNEDFDHFFIFDDLWGAAHPVLVNSMLRYATWWDCLSIGSRVT